MPLTRHAQKRLQQRGIPEFIVDVLMDFGHTKQSCGGVEIVYLTKRDKQIVAGSLDDKQVCSRIRNTYVVIGRNGNVVTGGSRYRRIKHN